jgi:hypothetical protein
MEHAEITEASSKEALKDLRQRRKEFVQAATARMRAQKKIIASIKAHLEQGAGTIPEIAAATGNAPAETLWYIAALKKYGQVVEVQKDGDFFKYALSAASETGPEA